MVSEQLQARFFEALGWENGSIAGAARVVGVSRGTAYRWASKAGIRGRGKSGTAGHPRRAEYDRLRAAGVGRREAAAQVGIHERTADDWDLGIRKTRNTRLRPDGRRIDYKTGVTSIVPVSPVSPMSLTPSVAAVEAQLHPRFLTVTEREQIADLRRGGQSLRAIGRALGRPASTIKREIDARSSQGDYWPHRAQRAWAASRARPRTPKLAQDGRLRDFVAARLAEQWSPGEGVSPRREHAGERGDDLPGDLRPGPWRTAA